MNKKQRIFYLDFIRVIAILLVIFIHVSTIDTTKHIGTTDWQIIKMLNYFAHISVPIFFMISGTLILNSPKALSLKYTWQKRIPRVVIPFVIWSIILPTVISLTSNLLSTNDVWGRLKFILNKPTIPVFWFMYPLIGVYILSPIIKTFVDNASLKMLFYVTSVWLVTCSLLPSVNVMMGKDMKHVFQLSPVSNFLLIGGFTGYFILGYLLSQMDFRNISSFALLTLFIGIGTFGNFFSESVPKTFDTNNSYYVTSLFIPIMSIAAFILLQKWGSSIRSRGVINFFESLAPLVFGIYLLHYLVIFFIEPWFFKNTNLRGIPATFLRYIVVVFITIVTIRVVSFIPGINYLLIGHTRSKNRRFPIGIVYFCTLVFLSFCRL
ncbi:acyltransferase [Companilactobacillus kimchii]|uniref:acyltransferase n=1 Tax=Companilactobacillus kimchii TaxID=2801452 RepID=UPI0006D030A1|nr:acyltransferase [Companilactobacillus kimchii]